MRLSKIRRSPLKYAIFGGLAGSAMLFGSPVFAANGSPQPTHTNKSALASAFDYVAHNSFLEVGALHFQYYVTSTNVTAPTGQGPQPIPGTGSSQGNATTAGFTYGLYLPRTGHHLAVQFDFAPPIKFDFNGSNVLLGQTHQSKIGTFKALPPNFTLVYRPVVHGKIRPYIGVGAMYLYTYDTHVTAPSLPPGTHLHLSQPWAFVGQIGADINITKRLFLNVDARYVGFADVKSRLTVPSRRGVATVTSTNHFKAGLYQIGLGYRF